MAAVLLLAGCSMSSIDRRVAHPMSVTNEALYDRGRALEAQGDEAGARECYVRSLEAEEAHVPSNASLGFLHALARECLQHPVLRQIAWREVRTKHFLVIRQADT